MDMLEPNFQEPFKAWKASPSQDTNAAMLQALHPTIEGAIRTHVGEPNPLLISRARIMALQGLQNYDPTRGRLQTHMYNHLQGLKRANRKQTSILKVPERIALDRFHMESATKELSNELGREPTDDELTNRMGVSPKRLAHVRTYNPAAAEGTFDESGGGQIMGDVNSAVHPQHQALMDIVYDELDPYHKKVMEHSMGLHGRRPLQNQDIARKMNRSPGAISQAKQRIQAKMDEMHELNPFGG